MLHDNIIYNDEGFVIACTLGKIRDYGDQFETWLLMDENIVLNYFDGKVYLKRSEDLFYKMINFKLECLSCKCTTYEHVIQDEEALHEMQFEDDNNYENLYLVHCKCGKKHLILDRYYNWDDMNYNPNIDSTGNGTKLVTLEKKFSEYFKQGFFGFGKLNKRIREITNDTEKSINFSLVNMNISFASLSKQNNLSLFKID